MIGLLLRSLIFASPIGQMILINKRIKGGIQISIIGITILTMVSTIILSIIGLALYAVSTLHAKEIVKCDMTVPAVIGIDTWLIVIVIPVIGIIGRLMWSSENHDIAEPKENPYVGLLKHSRKSNLKRPN